MRIGVAVGVAAFSLLLPATPASAADPQDVVAANAQNASDQTAANLAYSAYSAGFVRNSTDGSVPNVSCSKPIVYGVEVLGHNDLIVAETHQTDQAVATAHCVNLAGGAFQANIEIRIEYCAVRTSLTTCTMLPIGMSRTATSNAAQGVAVPVAEMRQIYSDTHAALGKVRRVWACVRTSLTGSGCLTYDYSGTYGT